MCSAMAELTQAEVYSPKSFQVWRTLLNWLTFFFQIFVQILRGTPSMAQVLSYVGFRHHSLLASSSASSSSPSFKPLPVVELPERESEEEVAAVRIGGGKVTVADGDDRRTEKFTVVLDLDETLVCAYETSSLPAIVRNQATEAGLKWFELECISSDKEFEGKPKVNYVTVFERPGLEEFLKQLSEFADLVLFTAGLEGYARPLVDRIDVENRFCLRLYRPSTISTWCSCEGVKPASRLASILETYLPVLVNHAALDSFRTIPCLFLIMNGCDREYREHVKDLSCLSKDLCQTVIVDNNPFSFLLQPLNGIPCIPFSAGQPHDVQLLEVLLPLLKQLSQQGDVRPVLYERFHMPEWFQKHGIPASGWT